MREILESKASRRLARIVSLGVGALALAGCVAPYGFVQPGAPGSGGYYTSEAPYAYDAGGYYGAGSYYAAPVYGYYDNYYGGYGYGAVTGFNSGFMGGWGYPGYGGPWYAPSYLDGCWQWGCGGHRRHDHHHHHHDGGHDPVATAPQRWLKPDHPHIPPGPVRKDAATMAMPVRPMEGFAAARHLPSAAFAPHGFARMPIMRPMAERSMGMPARPMSLSHSQESAGFAPRSLTPMPSERPARFVPAPRAVTGPAPVRSSNHAASIRRN